MSTTIQKIRLKNFKRFRDYTIKPNPRFNVLVGDNEVGKSTILEAIDLVASGSIHRLEYIGFDKLLNIDAVNQFNAGKRTYENLPELRIELYLNGNFDFKMNGENNLEGIDCDGIRLVCEPNQDYRNEINEILKSNINYFPYDYYSYRFSTFADEGYTGYKKKIQCVVIDSENMNSEYATNDFIQRMYMQYTEDDVKERVMHKSQYRKMRTKYCEENLSALNKRIPEERNYSFGLKNGEAMALDGDLMIYEDQVGIDSKGTGEQTFVKTVFALERAGENIDVVLMEEPENHLSPVNLRKLIQLVADTQGGQLFITTHNSLISTRLELNNLLIMQISEDNHPISLKDLSEDTSKYFKKAPPAGIIEFALSRKAILVEGPSEYMMLDNFYKSCTKCTPEKDDVNIIDVRALSFKRYLEIARLSGNKIAVITDNDKDYQKNCVEKYDDFSEDPNIQVFYDTDDSKWTFECVLLEKNQDLCKSLFGDNPLHYMLSNKTEAAYRLLNQDQGIVVPEYIQRAIQWIRE